MRDDLNVNGAAAGMGSDRKQRSTRSDLRTILNAGLDYLEPEARGECLRLRGQRKRKTTTTTPTKLALASIYAGTHLTVQLNTDNDMQVNTDNDMQVNTDNDSNPPGAPEGRAQCWLWR